MAGFELALENFIGNVAAYKDALVSATHASWSGSGYSLELFEDGHYQVLWRKEIGNLYQSPGIILALPPLDDECVPEFPDIVQWADWAFDQEADEIAAQLRRALKNDE